MKDKQIALACQWQRILQACQTQNQKDHCSTHVMGEFESEPSGTYLTSVICLFSSACIMRAAAVSPSLLVHKVKPDTKLVKYGHKLNLADARCL